MLKLVVFVVVFLIVLGILSIAVCIASEDFYEIVESEGDEK